MDSARVTGEAGDQELAADGVRRFAVEAGPGFGAGRAEAEALCVGRGGHVPCSLHGVVHIAADLVHAHDKDDLLRAEGNCRNAVGIPVDVDEDPVVRDGVAAG